MMGLCFFKQKTAYEMVSCDWSSDVCSSDLPLNKKLIPAAQIKDKWETFCLTVIKNPKDPGSNMLVIFGSDPRGTAFGVFEFSKMLGVSPWVWWADVKPKPVQQIFVTAGKSIIGPQIGRASCRERV